jgi:hypothetical protein
MVKCVLNDQYSPYQIPRLVTSSHAKFYACGYILPAYYSILLVASQYNSSFCKYQSLT